MDHKGELPSAEVSSAATVWVEVQQEIDKAGQLALGEVLAILRALVKHGQEPECVKDLGLETIKKMTITLQAGTLNTEIHPTLNQDIFELALDAFKKFINYVPALYLANPSNFESQLSEIFSEGMQNAPVEHS